jgi:DNA-binding response OmpR family regulator
MAENRILIVDDDSSIRRLLSYLLEKAGYDVLSAEDGVEALSKVESMKPNIVITDLMMANKDGYELCREIRARREFDKLFIIVLTARDAVSDIDVLTASGVNYIMKKPINPQELTKKVREVFGDQQ